MDHEEHVHHPRHPANGKRTRTRLALAATLHCLAGCGLGEILGMLAGTSLGWGNGATLAAAVVLAFAFGYAFTLVPLVRGGLSPAAAARLALASDTASIAIMEIVDNVVMLVVPGAMDAAIETPLFWGAMAVSIALAAAAAYPLNRWLISRGRGHALVHERHAAQGA